MPQNSTLLVLGAGSEIYRRYILESLRTRHRVVLVDSAPPPWARELGLAVLQADHRSAVAVQAALSQHPDPANTVDDPFNTIDGVLTYDEFAVTAASDLAHHLQLPSPGVDAARKCRDKSATRRALENGGVSSARWRLVEAGTRLTEGAAGHIATQLGGYPLVVKPRAQAGSIGVVLVTNPSEMTEAIAGALQMRLSDAEPPGALVEQYLDGPEVSVDTVMLNGQPLVSLLTHKRLGFAPWFEEVGHVVAGSGAVWRAADGIPSEPAICMAHAALAAVDFRTGAAHTELRLTSAGPRVVEINARLGGDLIPYIGRLATGVDLAAAAGAVAVGQEPDVPGDTRGAAAVVYVYPDQDCRFESAALNPQWPVPTWLNYLAWEAGPGDELRLPPRGFLARVGLAVVTGQNSEECLDRCAEVSAQIRLTSAELTGADSLDSSRAALFRTLEWRHAWQRATIESVLARELVQYDHGALPATLIANSPLWSGYETEAGFGPVFGDSFVSAPSLYDVHAPLEEATEPQALAQLASQLLDRAHAWRASGLLVPNVPRPVASELASHHGGVMLPLDLGYEAELTGSGISTHLDKLDGHVRREFGRQWRRAGEQGVRLRIETGRQAIDASPVICQLAEQSAGKHGMSLYDEPTIRAMASIPQARLLIAEQAGAPVGAFMAFLHNRRALLWCGGVDYNNLTQLNTYAFLMYEAFVFAYANGCRWLDAGRGNFRFKERHGFQAVQLWAVGWATDEDPAVRHTVRARLEEAQVQLGKFLRDHAGWEPGHSGAR